MTGWGEVASHQQHSRWFAHSLDPALPEPPAGSLAGGPNSFTGTWDPTMQSTFTQGCAPSMCYLDIISSWASNEITVNWNSALSWVASFVADQGSGAPVQVAPAITQQPASVTAGLGSTATFTDLKVYLKRGGPLYNTGNDVLGNQYGPTFTVDSLPKVPANTRISLSDVANTAFWSPYP